MHREPRTNFHLLASSHGIQSRDKSTRAHGGAGPADLPGWRRNPA